MRSLCRLPVAKTHNFEQTLTILGGSCIDPLLPMSQIWCAVTDPRSTLTCDISSRSVYSAKKSQFLPYFAIFWISAFSGVSSWQQSEKIAHGCTTTNLSLSNGIKIVSVLHRLHGEIGRTVSDVQKRDEQTNKQTNRQRNSTFLATPAAGEIRAPPLLAW